MWITQRMCVCVCVSYKIKAIAFRASTHAVNVFENDSTFVSPLMREWSWDFAWIYSC